MCSAVEAYQNCRDAAVGEPGLKVNRTRDIPECDAHAELFYFEILLTNLLPRIALCLTKIFLEDEFLV